jgi:acetyl esterase/lipase
MKYLVLVLAAAVAAFALIRGGASGVSYEELLARTPPRADARIPYGAAALQFGDLYLPKGHGPYPVIVLIHGGCWLAELPGLELVAPLAGGLRERGFAVWNIEYRRLGHEGGGYPGTFADVAKAVDELRALAPRYRLDLSRVVAVGHSAGGHLALWGAARARLPRTSALYIRDPLALRGAVSLAGIDDLEAYRLSGGGACGGPSTIDRLVGHRPDAFADTSPARLLPLGVPQTVISGSDDGIVAAHFGRDYARKARAAGDRVDDIEIHGAGHFDLIDPQSPAWPRIAAAIDRVAK